MALDKIPMIKVIRAVTGLGLRDAKDVADAIFDATAILASHQPAVDRAIEHVTWAEARNTPPSLLDVLRERQDAALAAQRDALSAHVVQLADARYARDQAATSDRELAELRAKLTGH